MAARTELPSHSDVVIVGGGIMGTSAAYFLSERTGLAVTLLEKDHIASGSTGDSSAILRHHYGPQAIYAKSAWWSHRFYRSFEEHTGYPLPRGDNPLIRAAKRDTPTGEYVDQGYHVLNELDIPTSRYSADEVQDVFPMFDFGDIDFAVSDDDAGYSDGTDAANGFARAARENGATILTGVEVTDVLVEDDRIERVETDRGEIACGHVVLAAGPWTGVLGETLGLDIPLLIEREQVVILDLPDEFIEQYPSLTPTTALPGGEYYLRPDFGDGILVATHHTREEVDPDTYSNSPDEDTILDLTELLQRSLPEASDAGIQGEYCGLYSTTPDHDFIIDQVGAENCVVACGFSGHGFKHGPSVGRIITDLLVDGETDFLDIEYFSLARFEEDPDGHGLPEDYA